MKNPSIWFVLAGMAVVSSIVMKGADHSLAAAAALVLCLPLLPNLLMSFWLQRSLAHGLNVIFPLFYGALVVVLFSLPGNSDSAYLAGYVLAGFWPLLVAGIIGLWCLTWCVRKEREVLP